MYSPPLSQARKREPKSGQWTRLVPDGPNELHCTWYQSCRGDVCECLLVPQQSPCFQLIHHIVLLWRWEECDSSTLWPRPGAYIWMFRIEVELYSLACLLLSFNGQNRKLVHALTRKLSLVHHRSSIFQLQLKIQAAPVEKLKWDYSKWSNGRLLIRQNSISNVYTCRFDANPPFTSWSLENNWSFGFTRGASELPSDGNCRTARSSSMWETHTAYFKK